MTKAEMPGQELRELRRQRGLTLKDVEIRSRTIAESEQNSEYIFTAGRLSQVENSTSLPSLYKIATLSQVYGVSYRELLRIYGVTPHGDWSALREGHGGPQPGDTGAGVGVAPAASLSNLNSF